MKTLTETKEEYAKSLGAGGWEYLEDEEKEVGYSEVAKRYAQQACEDLKERIAENARTKYIRYDNPSGVFHGEDVVDKDSILNTQIILP